MTVKDERLYIGGLGKEWTSQEGVSAGREASGLATVPQTHSIQQQYVIYTPAVVCHIYTSSSMSYIHQQYVIYTPAVCHIYTSSMSYTAAVCRIYISSMSYIHQQYVIYTAAVCHIHQQQYVIYTAAVCHIYTSSMSYIQQQYRNSLLFRLENFRKKNIRVK